MAQAAVYLIKEDKDPKNRFPPVFFNENMKLILYLKLFALNKGILKFGFWLQANSNLIYLHLCIYSTMTANQCTLLSV